MPISATIRGVLATSAALLGFAAAIPVQAQTAVDPGDYTALPPGTDLALVYGQFINRDKLKLPGGGELKDDTNLNTSVALLRYVHFTKLGPFVVDPQIIVPVGSVHDARVGRQNLGSSTGIGDVLVFATIWFVNKPSDNYSTYLGFSPIVGIPTGTYDRNKAVNFGNNRWSFDPQIGFIQGLGKNVTLDLYGDVNFFTVNNDVGALSQRLTKKPVYHVQSWLRYALPDKKTTIAIGTASMWGGKEHLDGVYTGQRSERQQIRLAIQKFVAPKWQLELIGGRDVQSREGFNEAARIQVRVLKIL
jgi:hypothetical protein